MKYLIAWTFILALLFGALVVADGPGGWTQPGPQLSVMVDDGCEYLRGPRGSLVHVDSCHNPVHWSHVLSDTSWYRNVSPLESRGEIHTKKGEGHGEEEGQEVR